jgi:hypothetical protein
MSQSGSGKLDPDLEGVELLFHQKGGSASFGTKMAPLSLNGVDPGCMNPITGSTCRAKCSNILHVTEFRILCDMLNVAMLRSVVAPFGRHKLSKGDLSTNQLLIALPNILSAKFLSAELFLVKK